MLNRLLLKINSADWLSLPFDGVKLPFWNDSWCSYIRSSISQTSFLEQFIFILLTKDQNLAVKVEELLLTVRIKLISNLVLIF